MRIVGIVAEYNPFHNGHAYQMNQARKKYSADAVVIALGGNYTQRGEFALMNKFARAEAAVECGADLVLEMPLPFSVAGAERFATGGVSILGEFCDAISCGCECGQETLLRETAELLYNQKIMEKVFHRVKQGEAYAVATEKVLADYGDQYAELIRKPNNILACEYQKAIWKLGLSMDLVPIARVGAEHDSNLREGMYASASHIRSLPLCDARAFLPDKSMTILAREAEAGRMINHFPEVTMLSYLRRLTPRDLANTAGCREGLEHRIHQALRSETTLNGVIERVITKRYPASRIRRILLSAYLGVSKELVEACPLPPYVRLLALNNTGRKILAGHRKAEGRPILTKGAQYTSLSPSATRLFEKEIMADDLYTTAYPAESQRKSGMTLINSPYYAK